MSYSGPPPTKQRKLNNGQSKPVTGQQQTHFMPPIVLPQIQHIPQLPTLGLGSFGGQGNQGGLIQGGLFSHGFTRQNTSQNPVAFHFGSGNSGFGGTSQHSAQTSQGSSGHGVTPSLFQFPNLQPNLQPTSNLHPTTNSNQLSPMVGTQSTGTMPPVQTPPKVKFRMDDAGKVHYWQTDNTQARSDHNDRYVEMSGSDFATFKNAGKRGSSNKMMDPSTGARYVYDKPSKQFYQYDKTAQNKRGVAVNQTLNAQLRQNKKSKQLVDRRRDDRTGGDLLPFDVGHYKSVPTGSKFDKLTGKKEPTGFKSNRDHVPSGESLKQRATTTSNGTKAYNEGLTIAIPDVAMHKPSSATYGGRQATKDKVDGGTPTQRKLVDKSHPAMAFHRDVTTMLDRTENKNLSVQNGAKHSYLDLSNQENRVRQLGAYRTLYRGNTRMNSSDPTRGVNPNDTAYDLSHTPGKLGKIGSFSYTKTTPPTATVTGGPPPTAPTQGSRTVGFFQSALKKTGKAT